MLWLLSLPFRLVLAVLGVVLSLVVGALALVSGVVALLLLPLAVLFWAPFAALRFGFGLVQWLVLGFLVAVVVTMALLVALVPVIPAVLLVASVWLIARLVRPRVAMRSSRVATVGRG